MQTVRFFEMMIDTIENGVEISKAISDEFNIQLPEDFDLNDSFPMLCEKTGYDVCSFRYEHIN